MCVNHNVGLSSIQWKASNRQGRPPVGVAWSSCGRAKVDAYTTVGKCAATLQYKPWWHEEPWRLVSHYKRFILINDKSWKLQLTNSSPCMSLAFSMQPLCTTISVSRNTQFTWTSFKHRHRKALNMFAATRQSMCIVRCHWRVYLSFSTCNSATHTGTTTDNQLAPRKKSPTWGRHPGKTGLAVTVLMLICRLLHEVNEQTCETESSKYWQYSLRREFC